MAAKFLRSSAAPSPKLGPILNATLNPPHRLAAARAPSNTTTSVTPIRAITAVLSMDLVPRSHAAPPGVAAPWSRIVQPHSPGLRSDLAAHAVAATPATTTGDSNESDGCVEWQVVDRHARGPASGRTRSLGITNTTTNTATNTATSLWVPRLPAAKIPRVRVASTPLQQPSLPAVAPAPAPAPASHSAHVALTAAVVTAIDVDNEDGWQCVLRTRKHRLTTIEQHNDEEDLHHKSSIYARPRPSASTSILARARSTSATTTAHARPRGPSTSGAAGPQKKKTKASLTLQSKEAAPPAARTTPNAARTIPKALTAPAAPAPASALTSDVKRSKTKRAPTGTAAAAAATASLAAQSAPTASFVPLCTISESSSPATLHPVVFLPSSPPPSSPCTSLPEDFEAALGTDAEDSGHSDQWSDSASDSASSAVTPSSPAPRHRKLPGDSCSLATSPGKDFITVLLQCDGDATAVRQPPRLARFGTESGAEVESIEKALVASLDTCRIPEAKRQWITKDIPRCLHRMLTHSKSLQTLPGSAPLGQPTDLCILAPASLCNFLQDAHGPAQAASSNPMARKPHDRGTTAHVKGSTATTTSSSTVQAGAPVTLFHCTTSLAGTELPNKTLTLFFTNHNVIDPVSNCVERVRCIVALGYHNVVKVKQASTYRVFWWNSLFEQPPPCEALQFKS